MDILPMPEPTCKRCTSKQCSYGFKGRRADTTKLLFVANMMDERVEERRLFGRLGHYDAFLESDSGKALKTILAQEALNMNLEYIYFTNVFKGMFSRSRFPTREEYRACLEVLDQQIQEFQPRGIVAMGGWVYRSMFEKGSGFDKENGNTILYQNTPTIVTYHPSAILKMPVQHRLRLVQFLKSAQA